MSVLKNNDGVNIEWENAEACGSAYYEVQKSMNGTDFVSIKKVACVSSSTRYKINDDIINGLVYYRISRVENKAIEYSKIRSYSSKTNHNFSMYPNPAKKQLNISGDNNEVLKSVAIYNTTGQLINEYKDINDTNFVIQLENFSPGLYFVEIINNQDITENRELKIEN